MSKSKPVYQYDLYGNFIKEYPSITQASIDIDCHRSGIRDVCLKKYTTSNGFQWRYKHEVHDKTKKIGLGKYSVDDNMKYLNSVWYGICVRPFNKNSEKYNPDLKVCEKWINSFDDFYYDVINDLERFLNEIPDYKKDIKNRHTFFSRIDKNKGWFPENTKFMTPDFCMRHKDETNKVVKDGRTLTPQMVVEELKSLGIEVKVQTVLQRIRNNNGLYKPNKNAKYNFNGRYYSLIELSKILDFDYVYVKNRILNFNESLKDAISSYKNYRIYKFRDNKNLTKREYAKLISKETGIRLESIESRIDAGYSEKELLKPKNWGKGKSQRKEIRVITNSGVKKEFESLSSLSRIMDIPATSISNAITYRDGNYKNMKFEYI